MDSGFSFNSKKNDLAADQTSKAAEATPSIFENWLNNNSVISVTSEDSKQGRNLLEQQGYKTLSDVTDDNNVRVITANSLETGGTVTIKIISKSGNSGFCRKKGFYQEIEMMRQLNHRNLIQYYRSIETVNRYYIVMECAQNGTLADLIRNEKVLAEAKAKSIYRQLASVLSYCNARGAIHHDIKSETILFGADNVLKISFFGYSYRSMLNHCVVLDTDCESSSLTEADYADVFRSGVVLYEMVYGKLPKDYDGVSLKYSLRYADLPNEPVTTSMCKTLISKILVPSIDSRISWNDIMGIDWML